MANTITKIHIAIMLVLAVMATAVEGGIEPATLEALPSFGNYQAKGFLSDYSKIKPAGESSGIFVYRNEALTKVRYKKILIDPIQITTKRHTWPRDGSPIFNDLAEYFRQSIVKAVGDTYQIVDEPGPEVLRLRIAVTDLEPNDPGVSMITLVVPFLWLGEASAGAAQGDVGSTPFAGQAVVEMEALDSQSNQQLAAYIERRAGKKYNWEAGIVSGLSSYVKGFYTWAYTEEAFDSWANMLRVELSADATGTTMAPVPTKRTRYVPKFIGTH